MAGPIGVDLEGAQQCRAADLIKFLFAFCQPNDGKLVPVYNETALQLAFEEAERVAKGANEEGSELRFHLSKL